MLGARLARAERLVAAGSLTECTTGGDTRVCDGAVTKELKSTTPSVQVSHSLSAFVIIMCRFVTWANSRSRILNRWELGHPNQAEESIFKLISNVKCWVFFTEPWSSLVCQYSSPSLFSQNLN